MPRVVVFDETAAPDMLHIVDEPAGEPAAEEVRIKIEAIGVNRLDELMRVGSSPRPVRLPHARLGCEGTGIVDAVGSGVEGLSVGDAVIITAVPTMDVNGTYAEYTVVPASAVIPRPGLIIPDPRTESIRVRVRSKLRPSPNPPFSSSRSSALWLMNLRDSLSRVALAIPQVSRNHRL